MKALIDTGAAQTLIDLSVVKELGLVPLGDDDLTTVSTGRQPVVALTYRVRLQLIGPPHVSIFPSLTVIAADLSSFGLKVLLGRDVLARCLFYDNGPSDPFTFAF